MFTENIMNSFARFISYSMITVSMIANLACSSPETKTGSLPIRIYSENPWYWEYKGEPVLLLGGSYEDNMYQFPNYYYSGHGDPDTSVGLVNWTLEEHLDELVRTGGNYIRGSMSCRNKGNRFPYLKIQGDPDINSTTDKYDLNRWDSVWEQRLETFLKMCEERDIIVSIEFFDRFDLWWPESEHQLALIRGSHNSGWEHHPWNPDRNINYTEAESGLGGGSNFGTPQPFYYCVPALSDSPHASEPIVLETLQSYIDKVLSFTFRHDNIIYIIENETTHPLEFGAYWAGYIQDKAGEAGKTVFVTNMEEKHDPTHPRQKEVRRNALYQFYDNSQNNHQTGQEHYDNYLYVRRDIEEHGSIKPVNNVKIYGSEAYGTAEEAKQRFWRAIFAGVSAARFHRPNYGAYVHGLGLGKHARAMIRSARIFTGEMNIFRCEPANELLGNRRDNEAFCLAEKGEQYAIYFNDGGSVSLDMSVAQGNFHMKWLDIAESEWGPITTITGGDVQKITTPTFGQWAVLITKQ